MKGDICMKMRLFSIVLTVILMAAMLSACINQKDKNDNEDKGRTTVPGVEQEIPEKPGTDSEKPDSTVVFKWAGRSGVNGTISLSLPDGWEYEVCPESRDLTTGEYGIRFYPEGVPEGAVEVFYVEAWGVCGTGLKQEEVMLAGSPAFIGTYDNHEFWDFITFAGENEGIVALTISVEDWWNEYGEQVLDILDSLKFEQVKSEESEIKELGLTLDITNITPVSATLIFQQDGGNPTGTLEFGEHFIIEKYENEQWKEVPIIAEVAYGFEGIAYNISKESTTEFEINWEWLYGKLEPGEYRIGKSVNDFRETGDFDKYMIYADFVLD